MLKVYIILTLILFFLFGPMFTNLYLPYEFIDYQMEYANARGYIEKLDYTLEFSPIRGFYINKLNVTVSIDLEYVRDRERERDRDTYFMMDAYGYHAKELSANIIHFTKKPKRIYLEMYKLLKDELDQQYLCNKSLVTGMKEVVAKMKSKI